MSASRVRGFLLQAPKPAVIKVTTDGEERVIKLGRSYAKIADTITALAVDLIECFDAEGTLLRAMRLGGADVQRSSAAAIPDGLAADPNALMLTHFANLIHRAYEHSTEIAFNRMVDISTVMSERSEAIEQRLERTEAHNRRLYQEQIDDAFERAEEDAERKAEEAKANGSDLLSQLAGSFLGGQAQATQTRPNGAARVNGKGKVS